MIPKIWDGPKIRDVILVSKLFSRSLYHDDLNMGLLCLLGFLMIVYLLMVTAVLRSGIPAVMFDVVSSFRYNK